MTYSKLITSDCPISSVLNPSNSQYLQYSICCLLKLLRLILKNNTLPGILVRNVSITFIFKSSRVFFLELFTFQQSLHPGTEYVHFPQIRQTNLQLPYSVNKLMNHFRLYLLEQKVYLQPCTPITSSKQCIMQKISEYPQLSQMPL